MSPESREVMAASNHLAGLLEEAAGRGKGLRHPRHLKTIKKGRSAVAKVIAGYFNRQAVAILKAIKPRIGAALQADPPPLAEAIRRLQGQPLSVVTLTEAARIFGAILEAGQARTPAAKRFASSLIPKSLSPLRFPVTSTEVSEYDDAIATAIIGSAATIARELKTTTTLNDTASSRYLRDNSLGKLTGNLQGETLYRLRGALADAWEAGGSFKQLTDAVTQTFESFSDVRAEMIAQTEVNDAYNWGRVELATEAGFEEKSWDPDGDACEAICQPNVDAGWIGIDEDFPSGDDAPTAHPNCDCGISFRKSTDADEEE